MKIKTLAVITASCLMLAACGGNAGNTATTAAETTAAETTAAETTAAETTAADKAVTEAAEESKAEETEESKAEETEAAGEENKDAAEDDGIVGYYKLTNMLENGEPSEEMAEFAEYGMNMYLVLEDGGTGYMDFFGEKQDLKWDDKSVFQEEDEEPAAYEYKDGVLTLTQEEQTMEFTRLTEDELKDYEENGSGSLDDILAAMGGSEDGANADVEADAESGDADTAETTAEVRKVNFSGEGPAGYYKLTKMLENGVESEEMAQVEQLGMKFYLALDEDGTGYMNILGEITELTWDDTNITSEDEPVPYTYEDGVMTFGDDEMTMEFTKLNDEEIAAYEAGSASEFDAEAFLGLLMAAEEASGEQRTVEVRKVNFSGEGPAGYYKLEKMLTNGEEPEEMAELEKLGIKFYLALDEDGTGYINMFGEMSDLTWDDANVTMDGEAVPYTFEDGTLTMANDEETTMEFVKLTEEEIAEYEEGKVPSLSTLVGAMEALEGTDAAEDASEEAVEEEAEDAESAADESAEAETEAAKTE